MPTLNINNDDIRLNSSSSDKVVVNGNLGIGTTSPGAKLTIGPSFATTNGFTIDTADSSHSQIIARKTSSKTAFGLLAWDTSVFLSAGIYYEGGAWVQNNHNGTNQLFNLTPGSGARWYASNNGSGSWNVSSDVQLWDDAAIWTSLVRSTRAGDSYFTGGNVGIGTTSPGYKLDVVAGANSTYPFIVRNAGNAEIGGIYSTSGGAGQIYLFNASTVATVKISTIDSSYFTGGNVGIGTTSPTAKLAISSGSSNGLRIDTNSGGYAALNIGGTGTLTVDAPMITGGRFQVLDNGNVGIGVPSPSEKLHVDGNVIVTYNNSFQGINSIGNNAILARVSPTTGIINYAEYATATNLNGFVLGSDDARVKGDIATDSLDFITNTSSRMFINSSGNVGIATTSPSYKLDVVGDSRITSGSLGVGVAPNATDGRIDASNDIVAYSTSDQRLKENVTPIENALEKVKTLTGVKFDWKEETAHVHGYHGHDVGIIAQDVQAVLPEAVRTNESGYLSVRYEKMIALLIEANKELAARVEFLEQKLKQ